MPLFKLKCFIINFKHEEKNYYSGCPECKKKVIEDTYGYACSSDSCGKKMEKPAYIFCFSIRVQDYTSEYWLDVFGNSGEKILKMNCEDYKNLIAESDQVKLNNVINEVEHRQMYFYVKPKVTTYNNQQKKRLSVFRIDLIDTENESRKLADELLTILNKI